MKHTVEVMISEQEVQERIRELGKQITERYQGSEDLVMVGLLRGSYILKYASRISINVKIIINLA